MKILWNVNVKLPLIYKLQGRDNQTNVGGWLTQICDMLLNQTEHDLMVVYPSNDKNGEKGETANFRFRGLYFEPNGLRSGTLDKNNSVKVYKDLLMEYRPDIIHVHGTEFQYSYYLIKAAEECGMLERVAVSIQGMVKYYAEHYCFGVPKYVKYGFTLKEFLLKNNVSCGVKSYVKRGIYEEKALKLASNVIGRTNWDKGCTNLINPSAQYYFCNETLRANFYDSEWNYDSCQPHSVFISQASYPIKGFHLFLKALLLVKERYPDVSVSVAGPNMMNGNLIKGSTYALYIQHLIKKYNLANNIKFLGPQNAEQMKNEMLKANVFVSPSTIENSPNSLGEAMILGVPCISSDVGGVADLMIHNEEGYIYPLDEIYMLAHYIIKIFEKGAIVKEMGKKAHNHAKVTHDPERNFKQLLKIYEIIESGSVE